MTSMYEFAEIEQKLAPYVPLAKEITGKDITLERMEPLMALFGNPHERLKIIHIAGTSGKTSTAYFMAAFLRQTGKKVGLTVSPHVDSIAERVQINQRPIAAADFEAALSEFLGVLTESGLRPTYFELLVAFAYWYFAKQAVDYAVVETGLGGLHDGTNIAKNPDKVCIITDIGLDHMHVLGNTVPEIARQKAGIIHPGNIVYTYRQSDEVMDVLGGWCKEYQADLRISEEHALMMNPELPPSFGNLPDFQQRNWLLAHQAYLYLQQRDGLVSLTPELLDPTTRIQVPGRMDTVSIDGKTIVMDGAHNEQKTEAFVSSFKHRYPGKRAPVLLSLKQGKEFAAVLPLLKPITNKLIITSFESSQDLPAVSIDPAELGKVAQTFGFENVIIQPDLDQAYGLLLREPDELAVITGSFYLLGQLRQAHKELTHA